MDRDSIRLLIAASALEVVAWSVAWVLDWQVVALAGAVAVSLGIGAVIVVWQLRRAQKR
jgi:hypothetical protein